jgi:prepilin-type N-terminal cleavage/methylation domain-containing protein
MIPARRQPRRHRDRRVTPAVGSRRCGFTLIELLLSAAILAVLSVAMGSAVLIASRAIGHRGADSSASRSVAASDALENLRAEIRTATSFTERRAAAVTFTVPDRDGDGIDETIRYAWSGVAGAPLTRAYNGSAPETLAEDVRAFDIDYLLQSLEPAAQAGEQETGETLLMSHADAPGGSMKSLLIDRNWWAAQYFKPVLPANATRWKVTRVQVMGRADKNTDGILYFWMTAANGSLKPAYPIHETVQVSETQLPVATSWFDVRFTQLDDLDPSQGLCLVIGYRSGNANVGLIQFEENGNPMTAGTHWMTSNDAGSSFTNPVQHQDMCFRLYGTVTTEGP